MSEVENCFTLAPEKNSDKQPMEMSFPCGHFCPSAQYYKTFLRGVGVGVLRNIKNLNFLQKTLFVSLVSFVFNASFDELTRIKI